MYICSTVYIVVEAVYVNGGGGGGGGGAQDSGICSTVYIVADTRCLYSSRHSLFI